MAIRLVSSANTPVPTENVDWEKLQNQLTAVKQRMTQDWMPFTNWTETGSSLIAGQGTYIQHYGAIYQIQDEDFVVNGFVPDGQISYVCFGFNSSTLTGNLNYMYSTHIMFPSAAWNPAYNGMYETLYNTYQILPFGVERTGDVYRRFREVNTQGGKLRIYSDGTVKVLGIEATTLDTGQGANKLYPMNQAVLTTSAPAFVTVNTGQGANELYPMNQAVLTTSAPTFAGGTFTGNMYPTTSPIQGSQSISYPNVTTWTPPRGFYTMSRTSGENYRFGIIGSIAGILTNVGSFGGPASGVAPAVLYNSAATQLTVYYLKY